MTQKSENYVTIFDSTFLPQALALIESMRRHVGSFVLWVIAMDDEAVRVLDELQFPEVRVIPVSQIENEKMLLVKQGRTRGEYCWTVTPFAPDAVFARDPSVVRVTYLDADLWFLQSPAPLFADFEDSGAAVLITEHAFSAHRDETATSGRFCVQFMTFMRNRSDFIRSWWQERCIEWCFAYYDDGKLGDQKYLDHFPERFGNDVQVASEKSWCLGPWNCERFPYSDAVFYHFHGVRIANRQKVNIGAPLPPYPTWQNVYLPYIAEIGSAIDRLEQVRWNCISQQKSRSLVRTLSASLVPNLRLLTQVALKRRF